MCTRKYRTFSNLCNLALRMNRWSSIWWPPARVNSARMTWKRHYTTASAYGVEFSRDLLTYLFVPFLQTHSKCSTTVHCTNYTNTRCSGCQLLEGGSAHAGAVHVEVILYIIFILEQSAKHVNVTTTQRLPMSSLFMADFLSYKDVVIIY